MDILAHFKSEGHVLRNAPFLTFILIGVCLYAGYHVGSAHSNERILLLQQERDFALLRLEVAEGHTLDDNFTEYLKRAREENEEISLSELGGECQQAPLPGESSLDVAEYILTQAANLDICRVILGKDPQYNWNKK